MPAHAASSDSEKSTPSEARLGEIIPHHSHNTEAPALLLHASPSRTNIRRPFWREPLRHTADSPPEADNRFDTGGPCCTEIPGSKVERSERPGISVSVREGRQAHPRQQHSLSVHKTGCQKNRTAWVNWRLYDGVETAGASLFRLASICIYNDLDRS